MEFLFSRKTAIGTLKFGIICNPEMFSPKMINWTF